MTLAFADWLALREPADAAARATDLLEPVRHHLQPGCPVVIHDLGCGTGSMGRWLAPRLPGPQHWVLHDLDGGLLELAAASLPTSAADGAAVTAEVRPGDASRLGPDDLAGAALVTASALLDILTGNELDRMVAVGAAVRCPVLLSLSVVGRIELDPAEPLDAEIAEAFNAHQRRRVGGRRLLGPHAVDAAVGAYLSRGARVLTRPSPWHLGPHERALAAEWLRGWVAAACEHEPDLAVPAAAYAKRRLAEAAEGRLSITVHHDDLLVRWP